MSWSEDDVPPLHGRVAVVTGASSGLGLENARALASAGAHVVMAVRDPAKARAAADRIAAAVPAASLERVDLDLSLLGSVEDAARAITDTHDRVDLLINNAGVMATPQRRTQDGFELQLATNHLGHFVLTARLLPSLLAAPAARVVSVTSTARHIGRPVNADDPHLERRYDPWQAYGRSKLANLHFALELDRRLSATGASVVSLVAHPGLSATELQARSVRDSGGGASQRFFLRLAHLTGMSVRRSALPQLRAATDPRARGGELYAPRFINTGAPVRRPITRRYRRAAPARTLWQVSERETGIDFDVRAIVEARS